VEYGVEIVGHGQRGNTGERDIGEGREQFRVASPLETNFELQLPADPQAGEVRQGEQKFHEEFELFRFLGRPKAQ
jgi:hypothetical protein